MPYGTGAAGAGAWLTRVTPVLLGLAADPNLRLMRQLVRAGGMYIAFHLQREWPGMLATSKEQGPARTRIYSMQCYLQYRNKMCGMLSCSLFPRSSGLILFGPPVCVIAVQASLQPDVCEAVFPALLQDLATAGAARDPDLPYNLARQIERHVLGPLQPVTANGSNSGGPQALSSATPLPPGANAVAGGTQGYQMAAGGGVYSDNGQPSQEATHGSAHAVAAAAVVRVAQIVLRALEHLRCLHTRIVRERKPNHQVRLAWGLAQLGPFGS